MSNARYSRNGTVDEISKKFKEKIVNTLDLDKIKALAANDKDESIIMKEFFDLIGNNFKDHLDFFENYYELDHASGKFGMYQCMAYTFGQTNEIFFENKKLYTHISKMPKLDIIDATDFLLENMDKLRRLVHFLPDQDDNGIKELSDTVSFVLRFSNAQMAIDGLIAEFEDLDDPILSFFVGDDNTNSYIGIPSSKAPSDIRREMRERFPTLNLKDKLMFYINTLRYILEKPERLEYGTPKDVRPTVFGYTLRYLP